jgi:hypothetical protein
MWLESKLKLGLATAVIRECHAGTDSKLNLELQYNLSALYCVRQ